MRGTVFTIFVVKSLCIDFWLVVLSALILTGCGVGIDVEAVDLDLSTARRSADVSDLAAVLSEAIDAQGRLAPAGLARAGKRLDAQLRKMALAGPTATPDLYPTDASRRAYWYNARAAWSMKLADLAGCRGQSCPPNARRRPFPLDGRTMTLDEIDSVLLADARRSGDFRLAACAPGVWADYAPMPRKPFSADDFPGRLTEMLNRLVTDEKRFVIDVEGKRVCVTPLLWDCRDMVISFYHRRCGRCKVDLITAMRLHLKAGAEWRLRNALGYTAVRQEARMELVTTRRKMFFPGSVGKIER